MWLIVLLLAGLVTAEPQYSYQAPSNPLLYGTPAQNCEPVESVVYTTLVRDDIRFTTVVQPDVQYRTETSFQQRLVPTTQYRTQIQTQVQYQTSAVQRQTQVFREQFVTQTQQGQNVFRTQYVTRERVVPQISYVTREQVRTQVVPVQRVNTRYETQYRDQVQYRTQNVQSTTVRQIRGQDFVRTAYSTNYRTSVVQQPGQDQTRYQTTTLVQQQVQTQSVPSPPVVSTQVVYSTQVVPTTQFRQHNEDRYVTRTQFVTRTNYRTQTQFRTQYVTQERVVTREIPREVVRTQVTTVVQPDVRVTTVYRTQQNNPQPVISTQISYYQSVVQVPGQDRVVNQEVVRTQQRQEVVYRTQNVPRQVTVTQTVTAPCQQVQQGYNYQQPSIPFNF